MGNARVSHGETLPLEPLEAIRQGDCLKNEPEVISSLLAEGKVWPFTYRFPDLQQISTNRLDDSSTTVESLNNLGRAMCDPGGPGSAVDVPIVYTFFGQFVDHDITFENVSNCIKQGIAGPNPTPIPLSEVSAEIVNSRSPNLDLDNVYPVWPDPTNKDKVRIDQVIETPGPNGHRLPKNLPGYIARSAKLRLYNDLPRGPVDNSPRKDRPALIGDPRNDDNLIISQLTVAFLHAHNALVDWGHDFYHARKILIQHYQWIVLNDFLCRITDPAILAEVRKDVLNSRPARPEPYAIPLEFSAAAYRFGHSQVRDIYPHYNSITSIAQNATLATLFEQTNFSSGNAGNITADWVIDWRGFVTVDMNDPTTQPRPIDTALAAGLLSLPRAREISSTPPFNLAVRNLLRGYILGLPTGQAFAKAVAEAKPQLGIAVLTPEEIKASALDVVNSQNTGGPGDCLPASPNQVEVLEQGNGILLERTPLWFYILAEAYVRNGGKHLGPVGSFIVAEVLLGILLNSTYSILAVPGWTPILQGQIPGQFDLSDLLRFAGVL